MSTNNKVAIRNGCTNYRCYNGYVKNFLPLTIISSPHPMRIVLFV